MSEECDPPRAFARPLVPGFLAAGGRALRRWRAKGPRIGNYAPASTLELPSHFPARACVPAINFHSHLGKWLAHNGAWVETDVGQLLDMMRSCNIESIVNLDGRWGRELEENLDRYDRSFPGRFYTISQVDWRLLEEPGGPARLVSSLERSVRAGARGLKVWKDLGTTVKIGGRPLLPDDAMLAPLWDAAGGLGVPVLVHVADPVAFFRPVDRFNERLEELRRFPNNSRSRGGPEQFHRLISSMERVVARHSRTKFIGAHGFFAENLEHVSVMFDRYPNFFVDIAWAHLQLGRQPRTARDLLLKHPDRVLFGTDVFPLREGIFRVYFRFLETADEYFSYTDEPVPGSGRWPIYGLDLPGSVLAKVYRENAGHLLGVPATG